MEWLLTDHDGSKKLRTGNSCDSCHGNDGKNLAQSPAVILNVSISRSKDDTVFKLTWPGPRAATLAAMTDAGSSKAFQRAGCWAACHDDVKGMSDGGMLAKYLGQTRSKMTIAGGGDALKPSADIATMRAESNFINIWEVSLVDAVVNYGKTGTILEAITLQDLPIPASAHWKDGIWDVTVTLDHPLQERTTINFGLLQDVNGVRTHYFSLPFVLVGDGSMMKLTAQ